MKTPMLCLILALASGCVTASGPHPPPPAHPALVPASAATSPALMQIEHHETLPTAAGVAVAGIHDSFGEFSDPKPVQFAGNASNVTVTATWQSKTPLGESLYISLGDTGVDGKWVANASGKSPLTFTVNGTLDKTKDYIFAVWLETAGATMGEDIAYHITYVSS